MNYWIGVACSEHVYRGVSGGFCQLCHGKKIPLEQMNEGDWIIYYSPTRIKEPLRAFTALGRILARDPYQVRMDEKFMPWRRDVQFHDNVREVLIEPLIGQLLFIKNKKYWGAAFRTGFLKIDKADFEIIATKMMKNE